MIHVAIVDDHPLIAAGTRAGLESAPDVTVDWTAGSLAEAREALADAAHTLDVVILDIRLPDGNGYELLPGEVTSQPAYLVMSAFDRPLYAVRAYERGAVGYLTKTAPIDEVLEAVRQAAAGRMVFTVEQLKAFRARPTFTRRERSIIRLVAQGLSNDEIATRLAISPKTVEAYLREIFRREGFTTRTELAVWAEREGWLEADGPDASR